MTATDLRALDGQVAQHLFGFRWAVIQWRSKGVLEDPICGLFTPERAAEAERFRPTETSGVTRLMVANEEIPRADDWARDVPRYTTQIEHAWLVVEAMRERGWLLIIEDQGDEVAAESPYVAGFRKHPLLSFGYCAKAGATPSEAIVRAALAALEERKH